MRYRVIWNEVQLFGDITHEYAKHTIFMHEYVMITKTLHEIPYHMVTHWNEVIKPYLPRYLLLLTLFSHTDNDN